jgi:hypothetical protein
MAEPRSNIPIELDDLLLQQQRWRWAAWKALQKKKLLAGGQTGRGSPGQSYR